MVHRNCCNIITIEKKYISEYLLLTIKKKHIYVTCSVFHSRAKKANPIKNKKQIPNCNPFSFLTKFVFTVFFCPLQPKALLEHE